MSIKRTAIARWEGKGTDGHGVLTTPSTVLTDTSYSYATRFADGIGTNPEELIAAAHAGCLAMKMAFNLQVAGYAASHIITSCEIVLHEGLIAQSNLKLEAVVPGLDASTFENLVADAQQNCPVSKLLNTAIKCEATLLAKPEVAD
ncbi:OsmC family peroxiredoxin [Hymenobacter mucosus]|uniref:Osmotically inducible protein OsmC n=1 Tax=Hymenobacter mucosus TaxID=1411120 RepID=A0A238XNE3_9BACT|nr:OsmC family peroxiredoxin [Hymenobacter mucosus]SNR60457.1 osmotically inducible protein OsmC [Hymenobacter mucosus]